MSRSGDDRKTNAAFLLFRVPVEGREKPFRATALPMGAARNWCPLAVEFSEKFEAAQAADDKYAALEDVQECGIETLKAYDCIEQGDRVDWDALTFEQVIEAINTLFEVNDPFTQAQNRQMAKLGEMADKLEKMKAAGVDVATYMPSRTPSE